MRLDHLLSKEQRRGKDLSEVSGQDGAKEELLLFSFEGACKSGHHQGEGVDGENGGVAQQGEHLPCKQGVRGSNPLISTSRDREKEDFGRRKRGLIAQAVRAHA